MQFSRAVNKMQTRRRGIRMLAILRFKAIRRDEPSQHDDRVDRQQEPDGPSEAELFVQSRAGRGISTATAVLWVHSGTLKNPFGNRAPSLRSGLHKKLFMP